MRNKIFSLGLLTMSCLVFPARAAEPVTGAPTETSFAETPILSTKLVEAHLAYRQAKLRLHEYRFVTLPQQRRLLNDQIRLAESEVKVLSRRARDYRPFLAVGEYSPARTAAQSNQLALLDAQQRLRRLKDERRAILQMNRQNSELYRLEVLRAATQLMQARYALGIETSSR